MTGVTKQPSRRVGIILPETVYEDGKDAAKRDRRSFSNYVVSLIEKATKGEKTNTAPAEDGAEERPKAA